MLLVGLTTHRLWRTFRRCATCAALALSVVGASAALAQDAGVYTVAGVEVDATGENDVAAKEAGVAEAKRTAFRRLFERLTIERDADRLPQIEPDRLERLIRDVTFEEEKFGGGRYLAELTVRFQEDAVSRLMQRDGIAYAKTRSRPLVVAPVYEPSGGAPTLWSGANPWLDAWLAEAAPGGLVPVIAPLGDLGDIGAIDAQGALAGDSEALAALAARYGAGGAVVAHAREGAGAGLSISIAVSAPGWPPVSTVIGVDPPPAESLEARAKEGEEPPDVEEATRADAVARVVDVLEEAWTRENLLRYDLGGTVLAMTAPIAGLDDLVAVERALEGAPPVRSATLIRTTITEAAFDVEYVGDIYQLQTALLQRGLTIALSEDAASWTLRRTDAQ
ncbi:MAG: DUF2066 domain-containing protein [Marivibrio sp.]|uniref:DUF2066 domain-containing protein n=1 Tax=Marivibrio sp. TaxID=2039719 RepID=UPI0032EBB152